MEKTNTYYRESYLRELPTSFCPGCGHGIVLNAFVRAIDDLISEGSIQREKILAVSGIGCSGWISSPHLLFDTLHTTHGRALAYATGAKLFNPKLQVFAFLGDGDGAGIGGNHLIHAARRNIGMTVLFLNNAIYGMTGGQVAPTTPHAVITSTTAAGNPEHPFPSVAELVKSAGATFVARWTPYYPRQLAKTIKEAFLNKGFSFIEVFVQCPVQYGRRNPPTDPWEMISELRNKTSIKPEPGKVQLGVLYNEPRAEFCESVRNMKKKR